MFTSTTSQVIARAKRAGLCTMIICGAVGFASSAYGIHDPRGVIIKDMVSSINLNGAVVVPLDSQYVNPELYHYLDSCGADSIKVVVPGFNRADTLFMRPDGVQVRLHDLSLYYKVFFADSLNLDSFAIGFQLIDSVSTSFPDGLLEFIETDPTDPLFDEQVYLQPESPGNGGAINAVGAWDVTTGDSSQIIAFIDSGIDGDHPDIDDKIFGGSFVSSFSEFDLDISGHGTSVAGILAAETNNGFGIAGINWATQLFVSRVSFNVSANQFDSDFAPQVQAATNSGAKQINMSLGGGSPFLTVAAEAMENAWLMDISLVGAKGNGGNSSSHFPSDYYYVVGVGALRKDGVLRFDSNWGHDVRLVAQGEDIKTLADGGGFRDFLRTSSAAPQVTAAISLVRAANPSLTADEAENILYLTAIDNTLHGIGYDDHTGYGTPDVGAAVAYAASRFFIRLGGPHTSLVAMPVQPFVLFDPVFGFGPIAGTSLFVQSWSARRYIDYSQYTFVEIPDILIRARSFSGWPLENSTVREVPTFRIVSQDLNGAMLETGVYWVNGSLWPCDNPPCESVANTNIQVTVAGIPGVIAPVALAGEGFDFLKHKQRVKLGWADQNSFEHGWIIERRFSGGGAPWIVIDTIPANASSGVVYYDPTVHGKESYFYRVRPYRLNNPQTVYSPEVFVTTPTFWPDNAKARTTAIFGTCAGGGVETFGSEVGEIERSSIVVGGTRRKSIGGGGEADPPLLAYTDEITVSWSAPANQNPFFPISHYIVQRLDRTFPFSSGPIWDNITGTSLTICNNPLNQAFPFKIWSVDVDGDTSMPFTTPSTPRGCLPFCEEIPPFKLSSENDGVSFSTVLLDNYPNPFNPTTTIRFALATHEHVSLTVYNILGQEVVTLIDEVRNAGEQSVLWDGRDNSGASVSSGIYFYRFVTSDVVQSRKMLLVK